MFGFGKKQEKPYRVVHYEGIDNVAMNIPCTLKIENDVLCLHFNSDLNVTLPLNRVIRFEAMGENDFLKKYKNTNAGDKKSAVPVSYLVITYTSKDNQEKRIVVWAANHREIMYFTDLHYKFKQQTGNIEL